MIILRKAGDRGHANHGWLDARHTFTFADYHDPNWESFRSLRVINEDKVQPGKGFGTHGHRDMEILSFVLHGALQHRDSQGNGSIILPGEVQRMSAGSGILHSEFNPSVDDSLHFIQVWIDPAERNLDPSYEQKRFPEDRLRDRLCVVASPDGREDSLTLHQHAVVYRSLLTDGVELNHPLRVGHQAWIQVLSGKLPFHRMELETGDGVAITSELRMELVGGKGGTDLLLFELC